MYKNKVAVVTGCGSFIATNLCHELLKRGWNIYGIDAECYNANESQINLFKQYRNFKYINAKIEEIDWLPECDVIFNLAAESHVDNGNKNSKNFIDSNIHGVRNLLELMNNQITISVDKPLFFHFSTDEVYGDQLQGQVDEDSPVKPSNPYAATKAAADLFIQSWKRTHGLEYIIVRPSNNYGLFQYPDKLIPLAVKRLNRGKKIKLHNAGTPIRTWTHVNDTIAAVFLLLEKADRNRIYNISSEYEQTNLVTAKKIINAYFNKNALVEIDNYNEYLDLTRERPGQDIRYALSCNHLKQYGWVPKVDFDEEIVSLVNHYKESFIW